MPDPSRLMMDRLEALLGDEIMLRIKPDGRFVHVIGTLCCEKQNEFSVEGNRCYVIFRTEHVECIKMVATGDPPIAGVFIILNPF